MQLSYLFHSLIAFFIVRSSPRFIYFHHHHHHHDQFGIHFQFKNFFSSRFYFFFALQNSIIQKEDFSLINTVHDVSISEKCFST